MREYAAPKAWKLPEWCVERARELGLQLDKEAAKELVSRVGSSQQRLSRELEKMAIAVHPAAAVTAGDVESPAAADNAPQVYDLADALVAGDLRETLALAQELEAYGERPGRLVPCGAPASRGAPRGGPARGDARAKVVVRTSPPPWLAKKTIARAKKADPACSDSAICVFADLEVRARGGEPARR